MHQAESEAQIAQMFRLEAQAALGVNRKPNAAGRADHAECIASVKDTAVSGSSPANRDIGPRRHPKVQGGHK